MLQRPHSRLNLLFIFIFFFPQITLASLDDIRRVPGLTGYNYLCKFYIGHVALVKLCCHDKPAEALSRCLVPCSRTPAKSVQLI